MQIVTRRPTVLCSDTLTPLKRVSFLPTDTVHGHAPGSPHQHPGALDSVFRPDNAGWTDPTGGPCPGDYTAKTAKALGAVIRDALRQRHHMTKRQRAHADPVDGGSANRLFDAQIGPLGDG